MGHSPPPKNPDGQQEGEYEVVQLVQGEHYQTRSERSIVLPIVSCVVGLEVITLLVC